MKVVNQANITFEDNINEEMEWVLSQFFGDKRPSRDGITIKVKDFVEQVI